MKNKTKNHTHTYMRVVGEIYVVFLCVLVVSGLRFDVLSVAVVLVVVVVVVVVCCLMADRARRSCRSSGVFVCVRGGGAYLNLLVLSL